MSARVYEYVCIYLCFHFFFAFCFYIFFFFGAVLLTWLEHNNNKQLQRNFATHTNATKRTHTNTRTVSHSQLETLQRSLYFCAVAAASSSFAASVKENQ